MTTAAALQKRSAAIEKFLSIAAPSSIAAPAIEEAAPQLKRFYTSPYFCSTIHVNTLFKHILKFLHFGDRCIDLLDFYFLMFVASSGLYSFNTHYMFVH